MSRFRSNKLCGNGSRLPGKDNSPGEAGLALWPGIRNRQVDGDTSAARCLFFPSTPRFPFRHYLEPTPNFLLDSRKKKKKIWNKKSSPTGRKRVFFDHENEILDFHHLRSIERKATRNERGLRFRLVSLVCSRKEAAEIEFSVRGGQGA